MKHAAFFLLLHSLVTVASAANWPQFRGPNQDGSSDETGLPEKFSKTEGVKWATPLPGPAASVPAIWGDDVFVSSSDVDNKMLLALCLDAKTGKVKWQHEVSEGYQHDDKSNLASPSPCTDGVHVFYLYGNNVLVAYDMAGKKTWERDMAKDYGAFGTQWTYSSSPVLDGGRLHIQVLQRNEYFQFQGKSRGDPTRSHESYILALDPATGKEIWKHVRPSDAKSESLEAFSTPVFYTHEKKRQMLINGGDTMTGHDAMTGKELWRLADWNSAKIVHWRTVPSPVAGAGVAIGCAPKKEPVYAVGLNSKGKVPALWQTDGKEVTSDVATPVFYQGKFYIVDSDRKTLSCVEPKTGKVIWKGEYPTKIKIDASPTAADGKIYAIDQLGGVFVAKAGGSQFELTHQAGFGQDGATATNGDKVVRSSIAVAGGCLFIRAQDQLYCVGK